MRQSLNYSKHSLFGTYCTIFPFSALCGISKKKDEEVAFFSNQTFVKNIVYPQGPIVAGKYMDIIVTVIIIGEIFTVII